MSRIERLTLVDLTNLATEAPDTPMHQGALGVLKGGPILDPNGRVRIDEVRTHLEARLDRVPTLRWKLKRTGPFEGRPIWVDDPDFRIENHVLVTSLPAPGGEVGAIEFAETQMAELMDRSRPLWQLWFLEGYGEGKVGVFLKLHHVLADGSAELNIVRLLFDLEPSPLESAQTVWAPEPAPTTRDLVRDNAARKRDLLWRAVRRLAHPISLIRSVAYSGRGVWEALKEGLGAPTTSFNRPVGPSRKIGVVRLPLADVKAIAHAHGVKVNDVILEVVAGGLRRVLESRRERVEGRSIRASMAVLLPSADRSALSGNQAGTMIVPLPVGEAGAAARLGAIGAATVRAKSKQRGGVPQALMVALAVSGLTRHFIRRQHLVNVLVTNLAGPAAPMYIAGARLLDAFAVTPIAGNVTASFAALSYNGGLDLSVHADGAAWPDLEVLVRGMSLAWSELGTAAAA